MTPSTIKYHINLPVDTSAYTLTDANALIKTALTGYNIASIDLWRATLGAAGWRVSVVFNQPWPVNAQALTVAVEKQTSAEGWHLEGPITAWIHP